MNSLKGLLSQNRAEEIGFDLWNDFVVPPYYDSLDLFVAKKPRIFVGGRGCGKTCLLRYLSHQSQFSKNRENISLADLTHIGLYWKIDTQFAKTLSYRGIEQQEWEFSFQHFAVLIICQEILKSLESIAHSSFEKFSIKDIDNLDFRILSSFNKDVPNNFNELKYFLRCELNYFQSWNGNIKMIPTPVFLPKQFIIELINEIKSQNNIFIDSNFFVYIDEFENLLNGQQRLINTWLKHSEIPLIFNLAMKRDQLIEKNTIGNEQIADIHDYREFDLEFFYDANSFEVFAAEILFLRLNQSFFGFNLPINISELRNTKSESIAFRRSEDYMKLVLSSVRTLLPTKNVNDIALEVFTDEPLYKRLIDLLQISITLRKIKIDINKFIIKDFATAGVIIPSLLSRKNIQPEDLLNEVNKLRAGEDNNFTGKTGWIHNNLFSCLLLLYEPLPRYCPIYSGFDSFCLMSKYNLRHFLEICNKSIINESYIGSSTVLKEISLKSQADAAKQASTSFLREIKHFGNNGNRLHSFVLRLGTIFNKLHKNLAQSEPEQNHFSIKGNVSSELASFLNDTIKWSVLFENKITKQKGGAGKLEVIDSEYILNPIYAPYFHISFRKKRSVIINIDHLNIMIFGNNEQNEELLKRLIKEPKINESNEQQELFNDLM